MTFQYDMNIKITYKQFLGSTKERAVHFGWGLGGPLESNWDVCEGQVGFTEQNHSRELGLETEGTRFPFYNSSIL